MEISNGELEDYRGPLEDFREALSRMIACAPELAKRKQP